MARMRGVENGINHNKRVGAARHFVHVVKRSERCHVKETALSRRYLIKGGVLKAYSEHPQWIIF